MHHSDPNLADPATYEVNDVRQMMRFADFVATQLGENVINPALPEYTMLDEYIANTCSGHSLATNFGGIGSTFTASNLLHEAVRRHKPTMDIKRVNHVYSIEKLPESQYELRALPFGPQMIFADINQVIDF